MATPIEAARRVHWAVEDLRYFEPYPGLPDLATIEGTLEVDGECEQFDPGDVTIYAWPQGVKMTRENAYTATPHLAYTGTTTTGGGLGGGPEVPKIETRIEYSLSLPLGSYVVAAINDGPCDGTWKKPTIGPNDAAVTVETVTFDDPVAAVDFTLQLYPDVTFDVQGSDSIDIGESAVLHWVVENASSVEIQPDVGSVATSGIHFVTPTKPTTYELTAKGPGGWKRESVTVDINPPRIDRFEASDTEVGRGDPVKFTWRTTNATDVSIHPAIKNRGPVTADDYAWDKPTSDTTYELTARGPDGDATKDTVTVTVVPAPSVSLSADPTEVLRGHQSATLTWRTTDANSVDVAGRSFSDANGQTTVKPTSDTTYTATAKGPSGTATATATVSVTDALHGTTRVPLVHDPSLTVYGRRLEKHYFVQGSAGRFIAPEHVTSPPVTPVVTRVRNVSRVNLAVSHKDDVGRIRGPVRLYAGTATDGFDGMSMENHWEGWVNVRPTTNLPGTVELAVDWVKRV